MKLGMGEVNASHKILDRAGKTSQASNRNATAVVVLKTTLSCKPSHVRAMVVVLTTCRFYIANIFEMGSSRGVNSYPVFSS